MVRKIIHIDEALCNGCGACAAACHEGAIGMVEGKARLLREDYCDGLGDCLPACPTGAITFEEREAPAYDAAAVAAAQAAKAREEPLACGCPSSMARAIRRETAPAADNALVSGGSELSTWPVQLKLLPLQAPYYDGAHLLVAADCAAYACGDFHQRFLKGRTVAIGCPKLDGTDYTEKLTEILRRNDIRAMTIVRMEVPCCGGLQHWATEALKASGKLIPWQVVTLSTDGRVL